MENGNGKLALVTEVTTVAQLAAECSINLEDLIPLLGKMGLKDANGETVVPVAIANNARVAVASRNKTSEAKKESPGEIAPQLDRKEIRAIAKETGLTQTLVRSLDAALHNRACQLAFLQGMQEHDKGYQIQDAKEAGKLAAKLQEVQRRQEELQDLEQHLIEEGLGESNSPTAIAKGLGIDLDVLLGAIKTNEDKAAETTLDLGGEGENPFSQLTRKRSQGYKSV